jgi:hypothetical protein
LQDIVLNYIVLSYIEKLQSDRKYFFKTLLLFKSILRGTLLVAQLVEALRFRLEGRGFDSRWRNCDFSMTILPAALWPWFRFSL